MLFVVTRAIRLCLAVIVSMGVALSAGAQEAQGDAVPLDPAALEQLIEVLSNDASRGALLDALSNLGEGSQTAAAPLELPVPATQPPSFGARIAELTQSTAEDIASQIDAFLHSLAGAGSVFRGLSGSELSVLLDSLRALFFVIVITVGVFIGLRILLGPLFNRIGTRAVTANMMRTGLLFVGARSLDIAVVLVAWALGYAISLLALGDYAQIGFLQALYLNAFLLVELAKVGIRAVLSPAAASLRLVNLSDAAASRLFRHSNIVASLLGYGQLLIVPIVNRNVSFFAGLGVSAIVSLLVVLYLLILVVWYRDPVAAWLTRRFTSKDYLLESQVEDAAATPRLEGALGTLVRSWHWFMIVYLAVLVLVVTTRSSARVFDFISGSGQVVLAILIGSVVLGALGRVFRNGVTLPHGVRTRLPLLEPRLNQITPAVFGTLRIIVGFAILAYTVDTAGLADVSGLLTSQVGSDVTSRLSSVVLILLFAALIWLVINAYIDYQLDPDHGFAPSARQVTLLTLARNAITITLAILTLMFALSEVGLDIGPLIASAGVLGLAIGFGAQKLVQDIITGVFIQFENAMNVGDIVTVGGISGTVEKLTVRSVSLRDLAGTFHIIPFSSVDMVSNFMRDFAYHVADTGVAYREDIDAVRDAMHDAFDLLVQDPDMRIAILGQLEWYGLHELGDSAVVLRGRIKTLPGRQWGVGRAYNAQLKKVFDERGIEIPFPHQTVYFGEDKNGRTQALRLKTERVQPGPEGEPDAE